MKKSTVLLFALVVLSAGCLSAIVDGSDEEEMPNETKTAANGTNTLETNSSAGTEAQTAEAVRVRNLSEPFEPEDRYIQPNGEPIEANRTAEKTGSFDVVVSEDTTYAPEEFDRWGKRICSRVARERVPEAINRRGADYSTVGIGYVNGQWAVSLGADIDLFSGVEGGERDGGNDGEPEVNQTRELVRDAPEYVETSVQWEERGIRWECQVPVVVRSGLEGVP